MQKYVNKENKYLCGRCLKIVNKNHWKVLIPQIDGKCSSCGDFGELYSSNFVHKVRHKYER